MAMTKLRLVAGKECFLVLVAADLALAHLHHPLPRQIDFKLLALPTLAAVGTNAGVAALKPESTTPAATLNLVPEHLHSRRVRAPALTRGIFPGIPLTIPQRSVRVLQAVVGA